MASNPLQKYDELCREERRLAQERERLESDPAYQAARAFKQDLDALLEKHRMTTQDALAVIYPEAAATYRTGNRDAARRKKTWRNPHTSEEVSARNMNNRTLKSWVGQYGRETVASWEIGSSTA